MNLANVFRKLLPKLPLLFCVGLFCFHFWIIAKYSINLPHADDWVMFSGDNHPASIDARWIYAQHNEHRIATTRILIWILFRIDRWNIRTHALVGFAIYGLSAAVLLLIARRIRPGTDYWLLTTLFVFLLAPMLWTMHFVALAVSSHFWLLFGFLTAYFLFAESQSWRSQLLACVSGILAIYSFASGFVTVLALLIIFSFYKLGRVLKARRLKRGTRDVWQWITVMFVLGAALCGWIYKLQFPPGSILTYPNSLNFWRHYLNIVSSSFGVEGLSSRVGVFFLLVVLIPIGALILRNRNRLTAAQWMLIGLVVAILGDLATITIGRAQLGLEGSKIPEYAEHGIALIVLSAAAWMEVLPGAHARAAAVIGLWLICAVTFLDDWNFGVYRQAAMVKVAAAACVQNYYNGKGDGRCTMTFSPASGDLRPLLDQAKRLNASFVTELGVSP